MYPVGALVGAGEGVCAGAGVAVGVGAGEALGEGAGAGDGLAAGVGEDKLRLCPAYIRLGFFMFGFSFNKASTDVLFDFAIPLNVSPF